MTTNQSSAARKQTPWYLWRYVAQLAGAGEIMLLDRSGYNRAGMEQVMDFCSGEPHEKFFRSLPGFEKMLVHPGIQLIKYWFSISDDA
jgi:polyphosphate kinase 2 (PPK2 family)